VASSIELPTHTNNNTHVGHPYQIQWNGSAIGFRSARRINLSMKMKLHGNRPIVVGATLLPLRIVMLPTT
jgi:hypothetical protein